METQQAPANDTEAVLASIDRVQLDMETVDFWACAFSGLISPVPEMHADAQPDVASS